MKNIILTGSSGMIGSLILQKCLADEKVKQVTSIVRKSSGVKNPKLREIVHANFFDYSAIASEFENQDIAYYCIGVYTGAVDRNAFRIITVDYTKAFAEMLRAKSENTTFCFLSGQGADTTEKSKIMFAQDKGIAENAIQKLNFKHFYSFRPGYIYPSIPRVEPNKSYEMFRKAYAFIKLVYPNIGVTSDTLGDAMIKVAEEGYPKTILENVDIRKVMGLVK